MVVLWTVLLAGHVGIHAQSLSIKAFATADGLAHNTVHRIVRDSRGFLWFCTGGGLSRFDGYVFTNFGTEQGLPDASVTDLLETRAGEYWVATAAGLARFDPRGRPDRGVRSENAATTPSPMFAVVAPENGDRRGRAITVLLEGADGTIWAGTNDGLYRLERSKGLGSLRSVDVHIPNEFPQQRIITDVLEDARGSLWIATPAGLYRRWPDGTSARYTTTDGLPNDYLSDLLQDHEGQLWAGTLQDGFFGFSADASHAAPVVTRRYSYPGPSHGGLPTTWVNQLLETSDRRFWITTARGLVEFSPAADERHRFRAYAERNGLTDYNVTAITEDLDGNLWLGTTSSGAMKVTRGGFTTYGKKDGIETLNAFFEDRAGDLCFKGSVLGDARTSVFEGAILDLVKGEQAAFYTRMGCFDGEKFNWFKPLGVTRFGWDASWVLEDVTLQARNGEWWVGTSEGLYRYPASDHFAQVGVTHPSAVYTVKDGLAAPQVFRLFEDSRGDIWISTTSAAMRGLSRWDHATGHVLDLGKVPGIPSLRDDLPRAFGEDRSGGVWVGFNQGLARYAHGRFAFFTATDGLPPGAIMNIYLDHSNRLWLASDRGGLVRVDHVDETRPTFVSYTTAQGLSSNNTEVIAEDRGGYLYVGGARGLDRIDPTTGHVKHFTTADGLTPGLFRAAFCDRHGVLWFGMTGGIARLVPTTDTRTASPAVLIGGLRVRGEPQLVSALGEQRMSLPDLAPDRNQLQIDFLALAFGSGEVLRYQYRLEGADADWSALSEQRTVTYASLAPGRYTFNVRAVNSDGVVSDRPASIAFTILRPLWLRSWFLTLAALAVGLAVYSAHRYRLQRLLDMANMRTRIAADLHDDIGSNLTRIALLSEVANRTQAATRGGQVDGPLSSIAGIARESVGSMSDIVWAINPKRETLLDLTRRMRQHADEIFRLRGIGLRFEAGGKRDDLRLGIDVRRDLLLIFKEVVNNAARHSGCSQVDIDFHVEGTRLVLVVADNGRGFDSTQESQGEGLPSMKRRAQKLKGSLEITSRIGAGTRVTVSVPTPA
jgi:ligand-binding sensor domain-containing protein/signal transduction histidine kinase